MTGFGVVGDDGAPLKPITGNNGVEASEKWIM